MVLKKLASLIAAGFLLTVSCSRDNEVSQLQAPAPVTPDAVNDFVWKAMNSWYYWQDKVPTLADSYNTDNAKYNALINGKTPDKLFYSLLYDYGKTDQFSWIENNNQIIRAQSKMAAIEQNTGLEIALFPKGGGSSNYIALVNYVIPNSSAANAGIKRGDVITKVNGSYLTAGNYDILFGDSFSITRAETASSTLVNGSYVVTTTDKNESLSINKTGVEENPIAHYQVYQIAGKKIGYLVYNGFKLDYNDELNAQFARMKADGITDLVLDLRYNGGGSLTTAEGLAQMITGSFTGQPYVFLDFNNKHNQFDGFDYLSDKIDVYKSVNGQEEKTGEVQNVNSLGLPKIYTLISFQTASASELTVTSLSKFINVETIGYATVGKFVGSNTLYDSPKSDYLSYEDRNKNHNWQLQPITFAYYNKDKDPFPTVTYSNGETVPGILPRAENRVHPYQWIGKIKEFGVTTDPELKRALELITGTTIGKMATTGYADTPQKIIYQVVNPAKGLYIPDMKDFLKKK